MTDWWLQKCEHCGCMFSKGWGHSCQDENGNPTFRDGMGELRPDLHPEHGDVQETPEPVA